MVGNIDLSVNKDDMNMKRKSTYLSGHVIVVDPIEAIVVCDDRQVIGAFDPDSNFGPDPNRAGHDHCTVDHDRYTLDHDKSLVDCDL